MKLNLRHKIMITNLAVLILTYLVISLIVNSGLSSIKNDMTEKNIGKWANTGIDFIKQTFSTKPDDETFKSKASFFANKLSNADLGLRALIFSRDKKCIADSFNIENFIDNSKYADYLGGKIEKKEYIFENGSRFLVYSFPINLGSDFFGDVLYVYPMSEIDKFDKIAQLLFLLSFAVGMLIILVVSTVISSKLTKPILQLKDSAKRISDANFKYRIEKVKTSDEISELSEAFNKMSIEIENKITMLNFEKSKINSVLESMGEGVAALNGQNEIISINKNASLILDEKNMQTVSELANKVRENKEMVITELNINGRNIQFCATPLVTEQFESGVVLILNDVTELRLLQEKQKQFVTNVSHELRTPLTSILGYIELLKDRGDDKKIFDTSIEHLENAGQRLLRLVNDLLDLSSLSKFEFEVEPKKTDFVALVKEVASQMSLKAQKFKIQITTDLCELREMKLDPVRLNQVMVNIIDNALKYSRSTEIKVKLKTENKSAVLSISDNGVGIPAEIIPKIFEPFYRVDKARARNMGGNGLGLAITKEIIEKHGGSIVIESEEGIGTEVRIYLPYEEI